MAKKESDDRWIKAIVSDNARNNLNALRHMLGGIKQHEALDRLLSGDEEAIEMLKTIIKNKSNYISKKG